MNRLAYWRVALALSFAAIFSISGAQAATHELSANAIAQLKVLQAEKSSRTPAQRKIDSQLLHASRVANGNAAIYGTAPLSFALKPDASGRLLVDIRVPVDAASVALVTRAGGTVLQTHAFANSIVASVPARNLEIIAADPRVRFIRPPAKGTTNASVKVTADPVVSGASQQPLSPRLQRFQTALKTALAAKAAQDAQSCCGAGPITNVGSRTSQGDVAHRANNARASFGVDGSGIRIGVLSDSFDNLGGADADYLAGDLTPVTLVGSGDYAGSPAGADEGRAMLQIVHDLAPGASLYFATAFNSNADFANNIRALAGIAPSAPPKGNANPGCNIIIDDVSYFEESGLHDGQKVPSDTNMSIITQAVNDVTAAGVLYFSSAANEGSIAQKTAGAWEGNFTPGPSTLGYGTSLVWSGTDIANFITVTAPDIVTMQWSDPINGACNDYDMYLVDPDLTSVELAGNNTQDCTNDPYEQLYYGGPIPAGYVVLVILAPADPTILNATSLPRFISLSTWGGQLDYKTTGSTRGHNAAATGFGVAATPAAATAGPPTPNGPYPGAFVGTNQVEYFSSDGPRQAFWDADGVQYTASLLADGGITRQKPDFTAADGVATTLPPSTNLNPFYGTSAAAPHAGAIAALVKQAAGLSATNAQITTYLKSTALPIMTGSADITAGVGILQAFQAVSAAKAGVGIAAFDAGTISATRLPTAGPILPGDSATMLVQIVNNGAAAASGVSAVLTASTPCITISAGSSAYPDIAVGANGTNATPFAFSLAPSCPCPVTINFTLTVSFSGGTSVINFSYVTGAPPVVINGNLNSTPVLPAGFTFTSGTQNARLGRGSPAFCEAPKVYPDVLGGPGERRFDAISFTTPATNPTYCVAVTLGHPGYPTAQLQSVGYSPTFDPTDLSLNYMDDSGGSGTTSSYAFSVPANTHVTITVNEVTPLGGGNNPYTLSIGGTCGVVGAGPTMTGVFSRKVQGAATYDLPLVPTGP